MDIHANDIVVIASCRSEWAAQLVAERLHADGIAAHASGGLAAGFRAEAPGSAHILVSAADAPRAREVAGQCDDCLVIPPGHRALDLDPLLPWLLAAVVLALAWSAGMHLGVALPLIALTVVAGVIAMASRRARRAA